MADAIKCPVTVVDHASAYGTVAIVDSAGWVIGFQPRDVADEIARKLNGFDVLAKWAVATSGLGVVGQLRDLQAAALAAAKGGQS